MLRNYLKTAWRNLINNPMHSFINAIGLSFGMAVAILIGLWIYDELSFDKHSGHHDRIAQVMQNVTNNGEVQTWRNVPYPLAEELRKNYGGDFKYIVMGVNRGDHILTIGNQKLKQQGAYFEKDFPEMFSLDMLHGDRHALNDPTSILIAASTARAYFGNTSAINQVISIDNKPPVKVAGVYNDFPKNQLHEPLHGKKREKSKGSGHP